MKENIEEEENKNKKDLIDENGEIDENKEKEDENRISNGLNDFQINNSPDESEKDKETIRKRKYVPKNEQEALKAKIINLELKEKPNMYYNDYNFRIHEN